MKKIGRSKTKRNILILLTIAITIIIIVASAIRNQNPQGSQKPWAGEYFKVESVKGNLGYFSGNNNETIFLKKLIIKITPIKGDAHGINVVTDGMDYDLIEMPTSKGYLRANETWIVEIPLKSVPVGWNDVHGGYEVELTISCSEVNSEPPIIIYLKKDQIIIMSSP
jgi:hypothetical protein